MTARVPGDAGLVLDDRAEGAAGEPDAGEVPGGQVLGGEVVAGEGVGDTVAGREAADVGRVPGYAPGDGAPPQAARPTTAASATASCVINVILMPSACAAPAAAELSRSPSPGRRRSPFP